MLERTAIPGVGAKTARTLYNEHGIDGLKKLQKALGKNGLAGIKGIGKKIVAAMRTHIAKHLK